MNLEPQKYEKKIFFIQNNNNNNNILKNISQRFENFHSK